MQSLNNILGDKDFDIPPEITEIKAYVYRYFNKDVAVGLQKTTIVITCSSAALAGSLRPHLHLIKKQLNTEKKLIVRIG